MEFIKEIDYLNLFLIKTVTSITNAVYSNPEAFGVPAGATVEAGEDVAVGTTAVSFTAGVAVGVAAGVAVGVAWAEDEYAYTIPLCVTAYSIFPDIAGEVM